MPVRPPQEAVTKPAGEPLAGVGLVVFSESKHILPSTASGGSIMLEVGDHKAKQANGTNHNRRIITSRVTVPKAAGSQLHLAAKFVFTGAKIPPHKLVAEDLSTKYVRLRCRADGQNALAHVLTLLPLGCRLVVVAAASQVNRWAVLESPAIAADKRGRRFLKATSSSKSWGTDIRVVRFDKFNNVVKGDKPPPVSLVVAKPSRSGDSTEQAFPLTYDAASGEFRLHTGAQAIAGKVRKWPASHLALPHR